MRTIVCGLNGRQIKNKYNPNSHTQTNIRQNRFVYLLMFSLFFTWALKFHSTTHTRFAVKKQDRIKQGNSKFQFTNKNVHKLINITFFSLFEICTENCHILMSEKYFRVENIGNLRPNRSVKTLIRLLITIIRTNITNL